MRTIKVYFSDGDTSTTNINGTNDEIARHYLGQRFEAGSDTKHHVALCVWFADTDETIGLRVRNIESGSTGRIVSVKHQKVKVNDTESYDEIVLALRDGSEYSLDDVWVYSLDGDWIKGIGYPQETSK